VDVMGLTSRGCSQVCVKVESEDQLLEMAAAATARGLVTSVIEDAGRTQVPRTHSSPILLHLTLWVSRGPCFLFGAMYPFKSGLIHKHIVNISQGCTGMQETISLTGCV
jgi:hypothetical protein